MLTVRLQFFHSRKLRITSQKKLSTAQQKIFNPVQWHIGWHSGTPSSQWLRTSPPWPALSPHPSAARTSPSFSQPDSPSKSTFVFSRIVVVLKIVCHNSHLLSCTCLMNVLIFSPYLMIVLNSFNCRHSQIFAHPITKKQLLLTKFGQLWSI